MRMAFTLGFHRALLLGFIRSPKGHRTHVPVFIPGLECVGMRESQDAHALEVLKCDQAAEQDRHRTSKPAQSHHAPRRPGRTRLRAVRSIGTLEAF